MQRAKGDSAYACNGFSCDKPREAASGCKQCAQIFFAVTICRLRFCPRPDLVQHVVLTSATCSCMKGPPHSRRAQCYFAGHNLTTPMRTPSGEMAAPVRLEAPVSPRIGPTLASRAPTHRGLYTSLQEN